MNRRNRSIAGIALILCLLVATWILVGPVWQIYNSEGDFAQDTLARTEREIVKPVVLYGMIVDDFHVVEDEVKRNQTFTDLLDGYYVSPKVRNQLAQLSRSEFDFRKIAAYRNYTLIAGHDSLKTLQAIIYELNPIDYVIFHLKDSLVVTPGQREVKVLQKQVAGVIGSSLSETIEKMGISNMLTNRFVDIFAWQIDFQRLQKGDRFKLYYEEQQVEGQPIGIGRIEGIYFEHFNHPYFAIPYDQGEGEDFYDENGNSLRKALLKYPIEFTRISSRYNLNRFHPIAKVFRAHKGTDFAAPYGTPIRSVGDGLVEEAAYNGRNGNYVKIRHNGTYTTQYLHMSRIAAGMRYGVKVRQGETIGYVGSTGLATGPHLCYRFWRNGVQVDALKVELPPSQPIKPDHQSSFEDAKRRVTKSLEKIILPEPPTIASGN